MHHHAVKFSPWAIQVDEVAVHRAQFGVSRQWQRTPIGGVAG
jgi:hypothetical protein